MAERKDYTTETASDRQWYVWCAGQRVAGPFARREDAAADARDRALQADGPATVDGEDVAVQAEYGRSSGPARTR
jgi:hypothetical protein